VSTVGKAFQIGCGGIIAVLLVGFCALSPESSSTSTSVGDNRAAPAPAPPPLPPLDSARFARGRAIFKSLNRSRDEMTSTITITHPALPKYVNSRTSIVPYFVGDSTQAYLRLRISYVADDWLFVQSVSIRTDSGYYDLDPDRDAADGLHRANAGGEVWEWMDLKGDDHYEMLRDIGTSAKVLVRFNGRDFRNDWRPSASDRKAIRAMVDARYAVHPRLVAP
jgi:hypothetical protein